MSELHTKESKLFIGLYIFFIFGAAMGDWKVLNFAFGALPKTVSIGALILAFVYWLWSGNFKNIKVLSRFSLMFSSIIIGIVICSILTWIIDLQSSGFILKGVSKISYQLLNIAIVMAAVYMFEENAAKYTFFGISAANFVIIIIGAVSVGFGNAVQDMIANITTFGANEVLVNSAFIRAIEIHDITFVMGVYVIYFLFFCPTDKFRFLYAGIALFLFVAGLKRIAFLSLLAAFVFASFVLMLRPKKQAVALITTAVLIVAFCYFYIVIIQKGIFSRFCIAHGIELNGREKIYDFIARYYEVSPFYRGKGYEFCVQLLRSMFETQDQVVHITAVHNDILKMYVELGFWGFLLWIMTYYVYQTHWFISRCGEKTAVCFMTISIYMLITYLTDNTMFYYWSSMVIRMIPVSFFFAPVKDKPLREKYLADMNAFDKWLRKKRERDLRERREPRMKVER